MARTPSADEKTVAAIVREALRLEAQAPTLPGETPPPKTVAKLGSITLEDAEGEQVKLGMLWRDSPAALVFLRHYGWLFCREQAAQLRGIADEAHRLGNLVIIGNGSQSQAQDFRRTHGQGLRSLVDPNRRTYTALGFRHGLRYTINAASVMRGVQATSRGFVQGETQGDAFQQGGTLVMASGGRPVFFYRSRFAGDHPALEEVLAAMRLASLSARRGGARRG